MSDGLPEPVVLTSADEAALRQVQLELLAEFDRVCAAHGLDYFALYGTALGAIRHGGFIPWDDDLDIGMLRADYDRLTQLIERDLGGDYFFQTVDSDPHYGCMFAKVRKNGTRCVDKISYGSKQHGGVFVDVFPLDARAAGRWTGFEQKVMRYVGFRLLYLKAGYHLPMRNDSVLVRIAQRGVRALVRIVPRRAIIALTTRHTRLGRSDSPAQYVSLFGAYFYDRDTIDADWIYPLERVPFEGTTIPVFGDTDAYLTQIYGDYMKPPPDDQRISHHELVEFEVGAQPASDED